MSENERLTLDCPYLIKTGIMESCSDPDRYTDISRPKPGQGGYYLHCRDACRRIASLSFEAGRKAEKGRIALKLQEVMNAVPGKRLAQVENLLTDLFKEAK